MQQYFTQLQARDKKQSLLSLQLLDQLGPALSNVNENSTSNYKGYQLSRPGFVYLGGTPQRPIHDHIAPVNQSPFRKFDQPISSSIQGYSQQPVASSRVGINISNQDNLIAQPSGEIPESPALSENMEDSSVGIMTPASHKEARESLHQQQLALLKQLKQQAMTSMGCLDNPEKTKENFRSLFQKVYGIIEEIEGRNQKAMGQKSKLTGFRRQLQMTSQVIQVSVQAQKIKGSSSQNSCTNTNIDALVQSN